MPPALAAFPPDSADISERPWIGPEFWSNPLQDWRLRNGRIERIRSGGDRNAYLLTRELGNSGGDFSTSVMLGRLEAERGALGEGFSGFRIGIRGEGDDYRDSAIYGRGMDIGITADGSLFIGQPAASNQKIANFPSDLRLELQGIPNGGAYELALSAFDPGGKLLGKVSRAGVAPRDVEGGLALVCSAGPVGTGQRPSMQLTRSGFVVPERKPQGNWRFWFRDWRVGGTKIIEHPERAFGPILWTMYTVSHGVLKLSAQMAPLGKTAEQVRFEIQRNNEWVQLASSPIDPLARNAVFRVEEWDASRDVEYRVRYQEHSFGGTVKKDPVNKPKLVLAALACLNDFGFPHGDLLASIQHFEADLLAFQGDQIYERAASYGIQRAPVEDAVLDFLRKWHLLGWSFRDILRNTPSVCQTDDHDMYQGNIWGAAGRHAEGDGQQGQDSGGDYDLTLAASD